MKEASIKGWLQVLVAFLFVVPVTLAFGSGSAPAEAQAQTGSRYFHETGHTVKDRFLEYWDAHGGLPQQGNPISDEMQEVSATNGKTYTVQYFERAVFELHPENQAPYDVLLSLLGMFEYGNRYGASGAPNQKPSADSPIRFSETGKMLGGKFRQYWESHGGLMQQGYPISDEFQEVSALNGKTYTVQYFQRAVLELHPENAGTPYEVLLAQLGTFRYRAKYTNGSGTPGQGNPPQCWNSILVPQSGGITNLTDISALPDGEAWAVGERFQQANGPDPGQMLMFHFRGTTWETVQTPSPGTNDSRLGGVATLGPDNVWAVGSYIVSAAGSYTTKSLVLHWDGKAWKIVPSPNPGSRNVLIVISALASDDIWAAGVTTPTPIGSSDQPFLLHWDGSTWTEKPARIMTGSTVAQSIVAVAHDDVWVTGVNNGSHLLTMHWDGRQWTPSEYFERAIGLAAYDAGELRGVTAVGPNDVWAVGYYRTFRNFASKVDALVAHWDGKRWARVPLPSGGGSGAAPVTAILTGVSAGAADDVWAVGSQGTSDAVNDEPVVLHWDGKQWNSEQLSKPSALTKAALQRVSAQSSGVWTVGMYITSQVVSGGLVGVRDRSGACGASSK